MIESPGVLLALAAGVLSFLSPCVLPLIPSYLSLVGGVSVQELGDGAPSRFRILARTLFFVLGFSLVFLVLGVVFSGAAGFLSGASRVVNLVAGSLVVLLGLNFIFDFWKVLSLERRVHLSRAPASSFGALLLGMAFGAGWTPCVGPFLASILFLAGSSGKILQGTVLLAAYSLGLGLPFVLAGLFFSQFLRQRDQIKKHFGTLKIFSGLFLVAIGVLMILGRLQRFNILLFRLAAGLSTWSDRYPVQVRLGFTAAFLIPALLLVWSYLRRLRRNRRFAVLPGRLAFVIIFLVLGVLTAAAVVDPSACLSSWFAFHGM
jgi:cytochrome c-type biogenesis protein